MEETVYPSFSDCLQSLHPLCVLTSVHFPPLHHLISLSFISLRSKDPTWECMHSSLFHWMHPLHPFMDPWGWVYRAVSHLMYILGSQLMSSGKAVNVLKHSEHFPAPCPICSTKLAFISVKKCTHPFQSIVNRIINNLKYHIKIPSKILWTYTFLLACSFVERSRILIQNY